MEVEGDHSASSISQGPSLDANESLASLSPPPSLHDSLDIFDPMHMSTSSESCSIPCYDIGMYGVFLHQGSTPFKLIIISLQVNLWMLPEVLPILLVWFVYSKEEDGLFCLPCVLFASKEKLGQLVTEKFNHWTKKTSRFSNHNSKQYHKLAVTQAEALKSSHNRPELAT